MDIETLGIAIAVTKSIPGSAAERAETAAETAETNAEAAAASAQIAAESAYGIAVDGSILKITDGSE